MIRGDGSRTRGSLWLFICPRLRISRDPRGRGCRKALSSDRVRDRDWEMHQRLALQTRGGGAGDRGQLSSKGRGLGPVRPWRRGAAGQSLGQHTWPELRRGAHLAVAFGERPLSSFFL